MNMGEMDLETAAKAAAGNWREFDCFAWHRRPDDADKWAIIYTRNRDSGLLDQSNANAIEEALTPFTRDVVAEHHTHWAVGWVDGFSIRVFRHGRITRAFRKWHELAVRLTEYPVLDDTDYCSREYEATLENLGDAAWKLKHEYDLPENWRGAVYDWFTNYDCSAIENADDRGGYPTEDQLRTAFAALNYPQLELV
jgi:hypothetical protein